MKYSLPLFLALAVGCVDVGIDDDETEGNLFETDGPTVEFDPGNKVIPVPNSLLLDDETGLLDIPVRCGETPTTEALRVGVLNQLDGYGTSRPSAQFTATTAIDPDSLGTRLKLFKRKAGENGLDPLMATEVPVTFFFSLSERFDGNCDNRSFVNNLTFFPDEPIDEGSVYTAVLLDGLDDETGERFIPSATWALVRQESDPVEFDASGRLLRETTPFDPRDPEDLESLRDLDDLWDKLNPAVSFAVAALGVPRTDVLLAWDMTTQTIKEPLDREVAGSLAADLSTMTPLIDAQGTPGMTVIADTGGSPTPTQLFGSVDAAICPAVGTCGAVGRIYAGAFLSSNYQSDTANPTGGQAVPGPWPDPIAPTKNADVPVTVTAFTPNTAFFSKPSAGWPVVIFGHGVTRSRMDVFAIASQLNNAGFAVITHDWTLHGTPNNPIGPGRAILIDDSSPQCQGDPDPTDRLTGGIGCYAPFISSDLAAVRDNLRQSALDGMALINALKTCTGGLCGGDFDIDPERIGYLGQSLGGIIGSVVVAMSPDIKAAVLNVTGVGIVDIIESTDSKLLQCPLVDALINAGVLDGELANFPTQTGTCFGDDWKLDPRWRAFASTARWIIDPADGHNYVDRLRGRAVLVQEVNNDETVPNVSTNNLTDILEAVTAIAGVAAGPSPDPSAAIVSGAGSTTHVRYLSESGPPVPNAYNHGSLLAPADNESTAGQLGTAQMQTDAITYLFLSL